jgi:putative membrane protein
MFIFNTIKKHIIIFLAVALFLISCKRQEIVNKEILTGHTTDSITPNSDEILFATTVTEINLEQINLGKLAQKHGYIPEVIGLGKNMENVYTVAQRQLKNIPKLESLYLPEEMNLEGKDSYERLMVKNGPDFDKSFSEIVVNADKTAITEFEKSMAKIKDKNIKEWGEYILPLLKTDLISAEMCQEKS